MYYPFGAGLSRFERIDDIPKRYSGYKANSAVYYEDVPNTVRFFHYGVDCGYDHYSRT